jgi:predicted ribosome quality control (RQC) complex YloA/Tae2 family protein
LLVLPLSTQSGKDGSDDIGEPYDQQEEQQEEEEGRQQQQSPRLVVGRNSRQNDRVTFSVARPSDRWFHARGVPGAHVLLRLDPGQEPSDAHIQSAADVSAFLSKARGHGRASEVTMASPRHLKRPRGAPPGAVVILDNQEEVIYGDPERGALLLERAGDA